MVQVAVDVFCVRGVCGRAGVCVQTCQCACSCSLPAAMEARLRAPPLANKSDACSAPNGIAEPLPLRGRPPSAVYGMIPVAAPLRWNKIHADHEPEALEQDGMVVFGM